MTASGADPDSRPQSGFVRRAGEGCLDRRPQHGALVLVPPPTDIVIAGQRPPSACTRASRSACAGLLAAWPPGRRGAACRAPHGVVIREDLSHPASVREDTDPPSSNATAPTHPAPLRLVSRPAS